MNKLPAARGLAWFTGSLILLKSQPSRLLLIGLILQFLMGFTQVGALGFLMILAVPALTAGVMQAMWAVEQGGRPPLMTLFSAFSATGRLLRLFALSAVMIILGTVIAGMVLSGATQAIDPDLLTRLERGDLDALSGADPILLQRLALAVMTGLLLSGTIGYFAIPLIWFRGMPVGSAIVTGLAGMLRNWLPLLVLGVLLTIMALPVVLLLVAFVGFSMGAGGASTLLSLIMLLVMVVYQLLLFGAQYLSFRDVFGTGQEKAEPAHKDDQLVA